MALIGISLTIQRRSGRSVKKSLNRKQSSPNQCQWQRSCCCVIVWAWLARADEVSGLGTSLTWELLMPNARVYALQY